MRSVCVFTNTLLNGGAEKQAILLAKALNKKYKVVMVVYYGSKVEKVKLQTLIENNIKVVRLHNRSHLLKCYAFYKILHKESVHILFSYLFTTNCIGGVARKLSCVRYTIGGIRNSVLDKKKIFFQKIFQNHLNSFTIYNNYRGFNNLTELGFKENKGVVIPNCFELNTPLMLRKNSKQVSIVSVGRFVEAKDYHTAIKSIANLRLKTKNFVYTIVGYGELERQIRCWIKKYDADDYISIVINPEDINFYYQKADIYLMTSIYEGLSNTVLEAMSHSLPLVITNAGDNDRLVKENKNGYLCQPGNYKQVSNRLFTLISSHEKRIKLGKESYAILKEGYSFEIFQQRYFDFIESLKK